jgi:hypothetical protein
MAVLIPDYVHRDCKSNAEKKLFERFKNELPDSFTVLHSLGLAIHSNKLRAEIDFVIVSTSGVLCIEVKGGRIRYEHGIWNFIDRYGKVNAKKESPFEQASTAMFSLRKSILNKFGNRSPQAMAGFGYCVVFPDQKFSIVSPEWDLNRLIDQKKFDQPIQTIIQEQFEYSFSETKRLYGVVPSEMPEAHKNLLLRYLRPDFDLIPSISSIIKQSHETLLQLTEEQYDVLDMINSNERTVVKGGAGTGKTLLAAEKAKRAVRQGQKILMICYNRLLAMHLRIFFNNDRDEKMPEVYTLHSFARKIIKQAELEKELPEVPDHKFYTDIYPELFENAFVTLYENPPFDMLIIDEGQDLKFGNYLRMLDWTIVKGLKNGQWAWFEDSQQNIFLPPNDKDAKFFFDHCHHARFYLTKNCRNTKPISVFNSLATATELQKCLVDSTLKVSPSFYRNDSHQFILLENIVKRILGGGVHVSDVVILSSRTFENSLLAGRQTVAGINLAAYGEKNFAFTKNIQFSTVHKFKGLESKVIIITDLDELVSPKSRALNYVAFSRATSYLEVLIHEKAREQYQQLAYQFSYIN